MQLHYPLEFSYSKDLEVVIILFLQIAAMILKNMHHYYQICVKDYLFQMHSEFIMVV